MKAYMIFFKYLIQSKLTSSEYSLPYVLFNSYAKELYCKKNFDYKKEINYSPDFKYLIINCYFNIVKV